MSRHNAKTHVCGSMPGAHAVRVWLGLCLANCNLANDSTVWQIPYNHPALEVSPLLSPLIVQVCRPEMPSHAIETRNVTDLLWSIPASWAGIRRFASLFNTGVLLQKAGNEEGPQAGKLLNGEPERGIEPPTSSVERRSEPRPILSTAGRLSSLFAGGRPWMPTWKAGLGKRTGAELR